MKVAFLGLGIMGRPMAANLVKAGHEVTVWNRTPGKSVEGARTAATPAEAAQGRTVVWVCVADTRAVEQVLFGENGVYGALSPDMIVADSSTILPSATQSFAARLREKRCEFVDAPVTGSKAGAESAQLVFIAGGSVDAVAHLGPLFSAMGKKMIHIGGSGMGEAAKIGMNLMIALIYEGFSEALTLTRKLGVQPEKMLELIQASMVRSGVTDYKAPFVMQRDFSPNFPLRLMHKDIHLMLEAAGQVGAQLPGLREVEKIYQRAVDQGDRDLDYAATLKVIERMAGVEPNPKKP